ncbi:MAG: hypothetical protein FJ320_04450 [SAR202 cluster bacterium]|nr:hypothetical protein [SAR202 cluster bacterium]
MQFYNVKTRKKVDVPDSRIKKVVLKRKTGGQTYAATAEDNGVKIFKIISKAQYDSLKAAKG